VYVTGYKPPLAQLVKDTKDMRGDAFRPGTQLNHTAQAQKFINFCHDYKLQHLQPAECTICYYINFLAKQFVSAASIRNYISGIRTMHKLLKLEAPALDSFEVGLMLRAANLTMRRVPNRKLPINPPLLYKLCILCDELGSFAVP
jgi:hypothetical protein